MTKEQWVELFRATGWGTTEMSRWHHEFESRHPEGHQDFLQWLGISKAEIERIRSAAKRA